VVVKAFLLERTVLHKVTATETHAGRGSLTVTICFEHSKARATLVKLNGNEPLSPSSIILFNYTGSTADIT
jgi:hypothetical protein